MDIERAIALDKAGADCIVVDTAHGQQLGAIKTAREIKKKIRGQLIFGNIATKEAAKEIVGFADAIKVGIGSDNLRGLCVSIKQIELKVHNTSQTT